MATVIDHDYDTVLQENADLKSALEKLRAENTEWQSLNRQRAGDADAMLDDLFDDFYQDWMPGDEHFSSGVAHCNIAGKEYVAGDFRYSNARGTFDFSLGIRQATRSRPAEHVYFVTAIELKEPLPC